MAAIDLFKWLDGSEAKRLKDVIACGLCQKMMVDPVQAVNPTDKQAACGHVFCKSCITGYIEDVEAKCPRCFQALTASQVIPDGAMARLMARLTYTCPSCGEEVKDPKSHFATWDECLRKCNGPRPCNKRRSDELDERDYGEHQYSCANGLYRCAICKERVQLHRLNDHFAVCYRGHTIVKQLRLELDGENSTSEWSDIPFGDGGLHWHFHQRVREGDLEVDVSLASDQKHYQRNMCITMNRFHVQVYHPVTGLPLLSKTSKTGWMALAQLPKDEPVDDDDEGSSMLLCSMDELREEGAYNSAKGLTELHIQFEITLDRVYDPQQRPGKRQNTQQASEVVVVSAPAVAASGVDKSVDVVVIKPAASDHVEAAVQVIVAQ